MLAASRAHHWTSRCGLYRITRLDPTLDRDQAVYFAAQYLAFGDGYPRAGGWEAASLEADGSRGHYLKRHRTLNSAMEAAEDFHRKKHGFARIESNREAVCRQAERAGLAAAGAEKSRKERAAAAVEEAGAEIPATTTNAPSGGGDDAMATKTKTKTANKKKGEKTAPKKTNADRVMEALAKGPATMKEIMNRTGIPYPPTDAVKALRESGAITKDDESGEFSRAKK